jgi:pimeloyl-ACP methyl ester carboxylesterase
MKVYFISGLAADSRVFKHIKLPSHCEPVFIEWIGPRKKESLADYAQRMALAIDTSQQFSLVGLSMGGMIASEIARQFNPSKTVLISSVANAAQMPIYFKWIYKVRAHKLVPVSMVKSAAIMKRLFTAETPDDKSTLKQIIRESDPVFIRWAMDAILAWNPGVLPERYYHIHGTKDEVLPFRYVKPTHVIEKGGHLMVMTRAKEINQILEEIFSQ